MIFRYWSFACWTPVLHFNEFADSISSKQRLHRTIRITLVIISCELYPFEWISSFFFTHIYAVALKMLVSPLRQVDRQIIVAKQNKLFYTSGRRHARLLFLCNSSNYWSNCCDHCYRWILCVRKSLNCQGERKREREKEKNPITEKVRASWRYDMFDERSVLQQLFTEEDTMYIKCFVSTCIIIASTLRKIFQ